MSFLIGPGVVLFVLGALNWAGVTHAGGFEDEPESIQELAGLAIWLAGVVHLSMAGALWLERGR